MTASATTSTTLAGRLAENPRHLSLEDSHRLWRDVLSRQGLAGGAKPDTAEQVAAVSLGLHAARLPSPLATLLARLDEPDAAEALFDDHQPRPSLTTVRCMRKTLHVLPTRWAHIAHTATRHFRERDARRLAHNIGLSPRELAGLVTAVTTLVAEHGQLGHRELETLTAHTQRPPAAVRAALKFAWESGLLTYRNISPYWNREIRRFTLTLHPASAAPELVEREAATRALVVAYFDRYGPAAVQDAAWWSGLSRRAVLDALTHCGRPLQAIVTPWYDGILYQFVDHKPAAANRHTESESIDFLAHEDVALKAYFVTRRRYLAVLPSQYAFNAIGEVLPTILRDGYVVGRWQWQRRERCVTFDLIERDRKLLQSCRNQAEKLTVNLRRRHDDS